MTVRPARLPGLRRFDRAAVPAVFAVAGAIVLAWTSGAGAIPAFARKYETSCVTCHVAFPRLNSFGKTFRNNGYRFPRGEDAFVTKDEPIRLGADSYKRVWPEGIWPTDVSGLPPLAVATQASFSYDAERELTTFEAPRELELLMGGTLGEDLSYLGEIEFEAEEVELGMVLQVDFGPALHVAVGSVGLDGVPSPPTQQDRSLSRRDYAFTGVTNLSGTWSPGDGAGGGVSVWGAMDGRGGSGGATYAVGVANGQSDHGIDRNREKDLFARVTYKMGGHGEANGAAPGAASSFRDDSVRLGVFGYAGTASDSVGRHDRFDLAGGDVEIWVGDLIAAVGAMSMSSRYGGESRRAVSGFAEGTYRIWPWLFGYARYEHTDRDTGDEGRPAEKNLVGALVFLLRANVKWTLDSSVPLDDANRNQGEAGVRLDFGF